MSVRVETLIACVIAALGIVWGVYLVTSRYTDMQSAWSTLVGSTGPREVCGVGVLVWLHTKWRKSVRVH